MTWGGKREGSGRKKCKIRNVTISLRISPDLKQKVIDRAKELNVSQNTYLENLIKKDIDLVNSKP